MIWHDFPDDRFPVFGLGWWEETRPNLWRFPERIREAIPEAVWNLSRMPSGGRIRFRTDSPSLALRLRYPPLQYMNNMPRIGQAGVDLYVDGQYWKPFFPVEQEADAVFFQRLPAQEREICLYLPLYFPVEVLAVGLEEGAQVVAPAGFARDLPVVYYGSSITQGGCASRAGMSYQAIVSRALNLDFINLGFSGWGRGEPAVAQAVAELQACCFVIDFCQNVPTVERLEEVYAPFLATIRAAHPDTPVICITPIFGMSEVWGEDPSRLPRMREVIRRAVADRIASGDRNLILVEGYSLLGPGDREGLVDASHPTDLGFLSMARGLEGPLRAALGM